MSLAQKSLKSKAAKISHVDVSRHPTFLSTYRRQQPFSLPDSIMFYIAKTPQTSKCYAKLVQSCKYFFIKNPILVTQKLLNNIVKNVFDLDKVSTVVSKLNAKIWVCDLACIGSKFYSTISSITPKLYKCDAKVLYLVNDSLSFKEFLLFNAQVDKLGLWKVDIKKENGSDVLIEEIVASTKKIKRFIYSPANDKTITSSTAATLIEVLKFTNLKGFQMHDINQDFNVQEFFDHIKNANKARITLEFNNKCSAAYKKDLDQIIDAAIEAKQLDYIPLLIKYPGHDVEKYRKLVKICNPFSRV